MKVVIDIPDDFYKGIVDDKYGVHEGRIFNIIRNGTPLPKEKWIPVMERMPEDGQMVLFCDIENDIMLGYHIKGRPDTHFSQDGTFDDIKNVKAWMPLPEPYEVDEEWFPQYEGKWVAESEDQND